MFQFPKRNALPAIIAAGAICMTGSSYAKSNTTATKPASQQARPNIILILIDDMDYCDLSITSGTKVETPNIDSIGKNGMTFTQAYVTCPVCGPSRAGILTGRYQDRFGYVSNHGPIIPKNFGLPTTTTLISEMLKPAGYTTGMIGKWHLGFKPEMTPPQRGFDYFFGHLHGWHDYHPGVEKPGPILRGDKPVTTTKYLTREFGDEAAGFIRRADESYFLYVPFNAVHGPLQAPAETMKKFQNIKNQRDRTMAAMLYELDNAVGQILTAVRESGEEENTLIIITNDNGGVRGNLPESNGVFRGGKASVYEGGIRVPLFIQWKGKIPAGSVYRKPVISLDFTPTFLALAHAKTTAPLDGVNLLPYINGKNDNPPHDEFFWKFTDAPNQRAVRKGDWKAVRPADNKPWELYNLSDDIGETNNLAAKNPEKLKELRKDWRQWNKDNAAPLFLDSRIIKRRAKMKAEQHGQAQNNRKHKAKKGKRKHRRHHNVGNNL